MKLQRFHVEPDKEKVLAILQAQKGRDSLSEQYDRLKPVLFTHTEPCAYFCVEGRKLYVLLTLGGAIEQEIDKRTAQGEVLAALLLNAMADQYLYQIDEEFIQKIRPFLAREKLGVVRRAEPGVDLPVEENLQIVQKLGTELKEVSINASYMFTPLKTLAYELELTNDSSVFKTQHDCSKCRSVNCPMRKSRRERNRTFYSVDGYELENLFESKNSECIEYGVGIDLGTTTIVAKLVDSSTGRSLQTASCLNHQREYGTDVMLRIQAAMEGSTEVLRQSVREDILSLLHLLCGKQNIKMGEIEELVIAGNVTMIHLLMGYDTSGLAAYPFTSAHMGYETHTFASVFGSDETFALCHIVPAFTPFVGGDLMAGVFAAKMESGKAVQLLVDLGTNGEMVLKKDDTYYVTSVAAGPAFEGGAVSCGTGSVAGAVCRFEIEKGVSRIETIEQKTPCGICGSGLLDILAQLRKYGIMGKDGTLLRLYARTGYPIAKEKGLYVTQEDIRQLQLAKGAVRAGVELLLKEAGISYMDVDAVYVAGGFGYHIQIKSALAVGLFPMEWKERIKAVGNSSLAGAVYFLSDKEKLKQADGLREKCTELVLAKHPDFQEIYLRAMDFPEKMVL